jgi:resuscitation-promoting factor RpfA
MSGRHCKPTTSAISVAKLALTGAVIGGGGVTLASHATAAIPFGLAALHIASYAL